MKIRTAQVFAIAVLAAIGAVPPVAAAPFVYAPAVVPPYRVIRVIDRPEMRSYQPYAGLQFGFRPDPPVERGVERKRPEVIMPTPLQPLIEYGKPGPYSAQWYAYCAAKFQSFEPSTGFYTTLSGRRRVCR